jgi:membrane protein implicated in regulation of membrane protease activity
VRFFSKKGQFKVVLVCLYDASAGSLFAAIIGHAAYNTAWQLFPNQGSGYDPWLTAALTMVVVVFAVAVFGARMLTRRHPARGSN